MLPKIDIAGGDTSSISVVIRNRNEAPHLARVLKGLRAQERQPDEIVIVDNASTDNSREVAQSYGARIVALPKEQFTYGRALNVGIRATEGRYVMILSAHSLPVGSEFVRKAVSPFRDDRVAAVRCLLLSKTREVETWMEPRTLSWPTDMSSVIQCGPAANGCVIRKDVWQCLPFDEELEAVEDKFWGLKVLQQGYLIVSIDAPYLYLRDLTTLQRLLKANREHRSYYRMTHEQWPQPPVSLLRVFQRMFVDAPRSALGVMGQEILGYVLRKSVPLQVRHEPREGSLW